MMSRTIHFFVLPTKRGMRMEQQTPRGRERRGSGTASGGYKTGSGLGTGPVGRKEGYAGRKPGGSATGGSTPSSGNQQRPERSGGNGRGGCGNPLILIILLAVVLLGGGGTLSGLFGGGGNDNGGSTLNNSQNNTQNNSGNATTNYGDNGFPQADQYSTTFGQGHTVENNNNSGNSTYQDFFNELFSGNTSTYGSGQTNNTVPEVTEADTVVAGGSRAKYTKIKGGGRDTVTLMIYMCGTDLESKSGMATSDLLEIANADTSKLNIIVYTGGCKRWNNNVISNSANQIYQVTGGGLRLLVQNAGSGNMTNPSTLENFIKWCAENFPANRNELILWDHGGGSVSGYGYDEKSYSSGSMTLAGISKALKAGGVKFDFVGFDACLMATAENALMLDSYADYLIASEETEPGIGWYYTNWVTAFSKNTSMDTLDIGQRIIDDFVSMCSRKCPGQQTTLSIIDLAEFSTTVPDKLTAFSESISTMIAQKNYTTVSNARSHTREFAPSTRIDQVDLINLSENMGTKEGQALAKVLKGAVKYYRNANITNAGGVSIYFPYKKLSTVDSAVSTYNQIGMNASYTKAIQDFAALQTGGQIASGGTGSVLGSLFGDYYSGSSSYSSGYGSGGYSSGYTDGGYSTDVISDLLNSFLGGGYGSISGLGSSNSSFLSGRSLTDADTISFLAENQIDPAQLYWDEDGDDLVLGLTGNQWALVHDLDLNLFLDDGEGGYIDLGLDNVYHFNEDRRMVADTSKKWLTVNGQLVAYYHMSTEDDGENYSIYGRIPAILTHTDISGEDYSERVNLLIVFDNDHPGGYVSGVQTVYEGETDTVAKNQTGVIETEGELVDVDAAEAETASAETDDDAVLPGITDGDVLQFICDYYDKEGNYEDSYHLGKAITVQGDLAVEDKVIPGDVVAMYRLTDIYDKEYWTETYQE